LPGGGVVVLAGGTGGAKLAAGMAAALGSPRELTVIANTADDAEAYGVHVAPDPDLITYWLAGAIDEERGYGIEDDSWEVMAQLEAAGRPAWFRLGDRDLAMCLIRTELLREGERLTSAHQAVVRALGVEAAVLPMCDEPVRTHVKRAGAWRPFQEFMILDRAEGPVEGVDLHGIAATRPTPEIRHALRDAAAILIGPSNPVISIDPILAVPGMRELVRGSSAPVVAVSPFVDGEVVKGPTGEFCDFASIERSADGVAAHYGDLLDGVVADEPVAGLPHLETATLMATVADRERLARETLEFARDLRPAA
jgi:LPPG:FO 2-phospho-L-lactate transferase